ncbi:MAG: DUF3185 family protein [Rhodospirillales bacterium]
MTMNRLIGGVVFAVGLLLLWFAYNATQAPMEELSNTVTGRYGNETMWYFAIGIAAVAGGGLLAAFGIRK